MSTAIALRAERLLHETNSLCSVCKDVIPARVVAAAAAHGDEVWMRKSCAAHGVQDVRISTSVQWYEETRAMPNTRVRPKRVTREVTHGCPFDCGACPTHEQKVRLPVVPITSACNLDCPICYTINKNDGAYHMTREDLARILAHLKEDHGEIDIINFTGGEPTMHPDFLGFMEMCREADVHRVTVSTNGILLAKSEALVQKLAELGTRIVLSFDSFDSDVDYAMQGATLLATKHRVLDMLEKYDVDTTLIPVMVKGTNDREVGRMVDMALRRPHIRSLEIHTMTYTGQGGVDFDPERKGRMSPFEVLERISESTHGLLQPSDFVPSPCAHPLCYQIAYLLVDPDAGPDGSPPVPLVRIMGREALYELLADRLYLEPSAKMEQLLRDAIDRLWAEGGDENERILGLLKRILREMFPRGGLSRRDAQRVGERLTKAVYVHSHMDEETFDTERIVQCCVGVPAPDGSNIPTCSYNILYREKDDRFAERPAAWGERHGVGHRVSEDGRVRLRVLGQA